MKFKVIYLILFTLFNYISCEINHFNNAILANYNFLTTYKSFANKNKTDIKENDFKNHLISLFDVCTWNALVIIDVPNFKWDYYKDFDYEFKYLQKHLSGSGTIDQIPAISKSGNHANKNLINDVVWTLEHKCTIDQDNVMFLKGNSSLAGFEKYIDTSKRIIVMEYDDEFLKTDDEDVLLANLIILDKEIGEILGSTPSPKTSLAVIGSYDNDKPSDNVVFPKIFNKNNKKQTPEDKRLKEKRQKAHNSRLKFAEYKPKFSNDKDNADDDNGMLFKELKTEITIFINENKDILKIILAGITGLVVIIYFFI
ncbi:hypothetical protein ACO0SA_004544 [Hanseniaspora valbyensis]